METTVLYREIQGTASKWVSDLLKGTAVIFALCLCINFIILKAKLDDHFTKFLLVGFSLAGVGFFITLYKLVTEISEDGIKIRFTPFHTEETFFNWNSIEEVYIRQFNPLGEYNGWGIKRGKSGLSFTFSGNTGIQLVLKNGERVLIGTAQPKQVAALLQQLRR